jgi:hypothetical protein
VATADPRIAWALVVATFKWNTHQVSIELRGPLEVRRPEKNQLESEAHG